jgi:hypothetical protein
MSLKVVKKLKPRAAALCPDRPVRALQKHHSGRHASFVKWGA